MTGIIIILVIMLVIGIAKFNLMHRLLPAPLYLDYHHPHRWHKDVVMFSIMFSIVFAIVPVVLMELCAAVMVTTSFITSFSTNFIAISIHTRPANRFHVAAPPPPASQNRDVKHIRIMTMVVIAGIKQVSVSTIISPLC